MILPLLHPCSTLIVSYDPFAVYLHVLGIRSVFSVPKQLCMRFLRYASFSCLVYLPLLRRCSTVKYLCLSLVVSLVGVWFFFSVGLFSVLVKILVFDLETFQRGYQHWFCLWGHRINVPILTLIGINVCSDDYGWRIVDLIWKKLDAESISSFVLM